MGNGANKMSISFVFLLKAAQIGGSILQLKEVSWESVENALENLKMSTAGGFIELTNKDDTTTMVIFGQMGKYHIGIIIDEEEYFYYWNGCEPVEIAKVPLAGNLFKEHQICDDFNLLKKIAKYFYKTGRLLDNVLWEKEII